jgi:hypothetical protein
MELARAVDASATRANRISQDREKERSSRAEDSRHLERCKCGLELSNVMVFIIPFPFCLLDSTVLGSRPCGRASIQIGVVRLHGHLVFHFEESRFLNTRMRLTRENPANAMGCFPIGCSPDKKFLAFCADTDVGVAVGSIRSEENAGFAIHCHGVKRTACPVEVQKRGGEPQTQFRQARRRGCARVPQSGEFVQWLSRIWVGMASNPPALPKWSFAPPD